MTRRLGSVHKAPGKMRAVFDINPQETQHVSFLSR